jgi:hypothetical protein
VIGEYPRPSTTDGPAPWATKYTSPLMVDTTSDTANATLPAPHRFDFHGSAYVHTSLAWRAQVQLLWYANDGHVVGRAAHSSRFTYVIGEGDEPYVLVGGACAGIV